MRTIFGLAAWFRCRHLPSETALAAALATLGSLAMLIFWFAWMSLPGQAIANITRWLAVAGFLLLASHGIRSGHWRDQIVVPLIISFIAAVVLMLWVHLGSSGGSPLRVAANRWTHELPGDNAIPYDFARAFLSGAIPSPLHGDWLSSDRPPLQTALFMITPGFLVGGSKELAYQQPVSRCR